MRMKNQIVQPRPSKTKKISSVAPKNLNVKKDDNSFNLSRSSSEVSIAHFSRLEQMRAEECLKNQPKVKMQEKTMAREGDKIVENLNTAVCKILHNNNSSKENTGSHEKRPSAVISNPGKEPNIIDSQNQNLYINNLYVQVNNFDPADTDKSSNEETSSPQSNKQHSSDKLKPYNFHDFEGNEKQIFDVTPDSDYESYSPSSRCSRSSRTSNNITSSEGNQTEQSLNPSKDLGIDRATIRQSLRCKSSSKTSSSSRSSSKENVIDSENSRSIFNRKPLSPNNLNESLDTNCLLTPSKPKLSIPNGNCAFDSDSCGNKKGVTQSTDPISSPPDFRRNSRTSRKTLETSNNFSLMSIPPTPLEYNGRSPKKLNKSSSEMNDSSREDLHNHDTRRRKRSLGTTVSSYKEENSMTISSRHSPSKSINELLKPADYSMLSTIKARRAINGTDTFQDRFFSLPNRGLVKTVDMKSRNISSSLHFSVLPNNQTKPTDHSVPPLVKRRKVT